MILIFLSLVCLIVLWVYIDKEDTKTEWDHICEIATSVPTEEQKEKAEKLRKKFHTLSFKDYICPYCNNILVEDDWDKITEKIIYKCPLCEEAFVYL